MKLMMFSKHLSTMTVAEAGRAVKDLGFEGVDLTVRAEGHVLPENVRIDLPEAVNTLADLGLEVPLITTGITDATEPYAADVFETAREARVPEIKLGYWRYAEFGAFRGAMDEIARKLDGIEKLAQHTGVRANIHVHSGDVMSASAPVIWFWIKDRDPAAIGAYADPGHMTVEGGVSGWRIGLDLLDRRIALLAVKDMAWRRIDDPALGKQRWITQLVPLNQGVVPWPEVFTCLRQIGFDGWISVHSEYRGSRSWRDLTVEELITQTREDLKYLRWAMKPS